MKDNFNLGKFLTENKLTFYGRVTSESKSLSFDQIKPNAILVRNQTGRRYTVLSVDKDSAKIKGNDKDGKTFTISSANINNYSLGKAAKEVKEANYRSYTAKTWKTNPKLDSDLEQAMNNPDLSRKQRKVFQAILAGYRNGDWGRDRSTHKEVQSAYDLTNRVIQAYRDGELDRDETYASFEDIIQGRLPGVEAMFEEVAEGSSYHAISSESAYELGQMVTVNTKPFLDLGYEFPDGDEGEIVDIDTADYASDDLVITVKINHIDAQGDQRDELIIDDWNLID
jgi:hypothetical protein